MIDISEIDFDLRRLNVIFREEVCCSMKLEWRLWVTYAEKCSVLYRPSWYTEAAAMEHEMTILRKSKTLP